MHRRSLLQGAAASLCASPLAAPAIAQPAKPATLRFVPQSNLQYLDPIWTTAVVVRNHGYLVWDTLYGLDASLMPKPQMLAGHEVAADGRSCSPQ